MKKFKLFKEIFYFSSEHLKGVWALFSTIFGIVYSMLARIEVFLFLFTFSCLVSFYFIFCIEVGQFYIEELLMLNQKVIETFT